MEKIIRNADYTYSKMREAIRNLEDAYPFIKVIYIGQSCLGREIPAIKIGESDDICLYVGAFHGSESLTTTLLLKFCEDLCENLKKRTQFCSIDVSRVYKNKSIVIIPRINPDGCEISICGASAAGAYAGQIKRISGGDTLHWNANLRGVDINHNFSAGWQDLKDREKKAGIYGPAMTRYGGLYPESEPETAALTSFCLNNKISHALAFHSQGEVIYWSFGDKIPYRSEKMLEIMCNLSGYVPDEPEGLAIGGGFKDWFIETFDRPAFTIEIGKGTNPLPSEKIDEIYEEIKKMMTVTPFL